MVMGQETGKSQLQKIIERKASPKTSPENDSTIMWHTESSVDGNHKYHVEIYQSKDKVKSRKGNGHGIHGSIHAVHEIPKMRILTIKTLTFICTILLCISCENEAEKIKDRKYIEVTKEFDTNDSITTYTYWLNRNEAQVFQIGYKKDTVAFYQYEISDLYHNYTFFNTNGSIQKIKQYLEVNGKMRINELVEFDEKGTLIQRTANYITFDVNKDSIFLKSPDSLFFNKLRVLIGDKITFDRNKWAKIDTIISYRSYIAVPLKYKGRKCVFQAIKSDEFGTDKNGQDFYFDIDNLMCRDIKKSLICDKLVAP